MPKPYARKMPATWWLKKSVYFYFMVRELTAVFLAVYCVVLLVMIWRIKQGVMAYQEYLDILKTPWSIGFHFVALLFAVYHSITWFNLTPKVMVIRRGEDKVPPVLLVAANYLAWFVVSAGLTWLLFCS